MKSPRRTAAGRDPIDTAWATVAVLIPVAASLLSRMSAVDLAYQLRAGTQVLSGSIPSVETYTFTAAGQRWLDQQWLAQGVLALADRGGGWALLVVLRALLTGLTFLLLYFAIRSRGAPARTSSLLTLAGFLVTAPGLALRPQLIALPLFAGLLLITALRHRRPAWIWLAPVLTAICANVHGSFTLFPLVLGLAWLEDVREQAPRARRTLLIAGLAALATLVTPFGYHVWSYAYEVSTNPVIRDTITEWAPLTLGTAAGWLGVGSFLAVVAYLLSRRSPTPWTAQLTLALFFTIAMSTQRALVWWGLVAPVVVGALIGLDRDVQSEPSGTPPAAGARLPAYAIVGVMVALVVALLPWWEHPGAADLLLDAPAGVTDAAGRLPAGTRTLVYQPWASWFEFANPDDPVFVDSRIELPSERVWNDYAVVASGKAGWSDVLDRWNVDAVVAPNDWPPITLMEASRSGWRIAFQDGEGTLLTRA